MENYNIFDKEINLLNHLNNYYISIGLISDNDTYETITILDLDGETQIPVTMKVSDIIYQLDTGTINLPGYNIFEKIISKSSSEIINTIEYISENIFNSNYNEKSIELNLIELVNKINTIIIPSAISDIFNSSLYLSTISGIEGKPKELFDIKKIKNMIKSKLFFKS